MAPTTVTDGLTFNRSAGTISGIGNDIALDQVISVRIGGQRVFWPSDARNSALSGGVLTLPKGATGVSSPGGPVAITYDSDSKFPPEAPDLQSAIALYKKLRAVLANRGVI